MKGDMACTNKNPSTCEGTTDEHCMTLDTCRYLPTRVLLDLDIPNGASLLPYRLYKKHFTAFYCLFTTASKLEEMLVLPRPIDVA